MVIADTTDRQQLLTEKNDWKIIELKKPYGAYRIKLYQSVATQCGSLKNKKQYNHLKSTIKDDVEIEFCTVSRFIRGKIVEELVIDNRL